MTTCSAELLSNGNRYADITDDEARTIFGIFQAQGFKETTLRIMPFGVGGVKMYTNVNSSYNQATISNIKRLNNIAKNYGLKINIDLHTWNRYTGDIAFDSQQRQIYTDYVKYMVQQFRGDFNIKTFMVFNEPMYSNQTAARKTTFSNFLTSIINEAKALTSKPVSIRFSLGDSPETGEFFESLNVSCDFLCRNTYLDARNPDHAIWGSTWPLFNDALNNAKNLGKEFWVTEFGAHYSNLVNQREYMKAFVEHTTTLEVDRLFAWSVQPEDWSAQEYNLFGANYVPTPAFYELVSTPFTPISQFNLARSLAAGGAVFLSTGRADLAVIAGLVGGLVRRGG